MRVKDTLSAFLWGLVTTTLACNPVGAEPAMGTTAPSLVVTQLDGQVFDLDKLRGKVVLVNYWASWCVPCRKEMPTLDAFYRKHHGDGFEMIGISIDMPSDLGKMRKAAATVAYPAAMLGDVPINGFGPPEGVPLTYVIDMDGIVRDKFIAVPNKLLSDVVLPLLAH